MSAPGSFTVVNDAALCAAIDSTTQTLVYVAPGISKPVVEAIGSYEDNGGRAATLILRETDYSKYDDICHGCVDHAGTVETAMIMALYPDLVDLDELDPQDTFHVGVTGPSPLAASPELGREILAELEALVRRAMRELDLDRTGTECGDG